MSKMALDLGDAFGYLSKLEILALQKYSKEIPENGLAVNIGAGAGTSSLAVYEARQDLFPSNFITIDKRNDDNPYGGLLNERNAFEKNNLNPPRQILGDSKDIAAKWNKTLNLPKIDFLIIDGDHSAQGIKGDVEGWSPLLNNNAIVFIHDYGVTRWPEVKKYIDTLLKNKNIIKLDVVDSYIILRYKYEN